MQAIPPSCYRIICLRGRPCKLYMLHSYYTSTCTSLNLTNKRAEQLPYILHLHPLSLWSPLNFNVRPISKIPLVQEFQWTKQNIPRGTENSSLFWANIMLSRWCLTVMWVEWKRKGCSFSLSYSLLTSGLTESPAYESIKIFLKICFPQLPSWSSSRGILLNLFFFIQKHAGAHGEMLIESTFYLVSFHISLGSCAQL